MLDVRQALGLPPVDAGVEDRFGPPVYTEAQVCAYGAAVAQSAEAQLSALKGRVGELVETAYYEAFRDGFATGVDPTGERDPSEVWGECEDIAPLEGWHSSQVRALLSSPVVESTDNSASSERAEPASQERSTVVPEAKRAGGGEL